MAECFPKVGPFLRVIMMSLDPTKSGLRSGAWTEGYDCQNKERTAHDC